MVREFHAQHRHDPGFTDWFQRTKLLSAIPCVAQLLRLDLLGHNVRSGAGVPLRPRAQRTGPGSRRRSRRTPPLPARTARIGPDGAAARRRIPRRRSCRSRSCWTRRATARTASWPAAALRSSRSHHAQQGRAEAPLGGARRIGLGQDHAGALHHRAAAAEGHSGGADRPQGRPVLLRQPRRLARQRGRVRRAARRARAAGGCDRRRGLHAGARLGAADLHHAAAQRHQRAARAGAAAARQPLGGGARRHAAPQELGDAPEAVRHAVGGAAHPGRALQQGGRRSATHPAARGRGPGAHRADPAHGPLGRIRRDLVAQLDSLRHRNSALFEGGGESLRMESLWAAAASPAATTARGSRSSTRGSSATTRTSCSGSRSSCRRRCASASATPTTSCRRSSCSTRPTSTSRPTPSRPPPSRCRAC